jgi:predicted O-methyltransferase YrrM
MTAKAERMLRLMDRAVDEWHIPVIGREKGRVLRRLLARHRPRRALEIGSLLGYSAILIGSQLGRGGRLTCIEQNPYLAKFVQMNADRAGLRGRVRVIAGDALQVLPLLRGAIDFVLIDAEKEDYLDYLRALEPRLVAGAVVVADNTGMFRREVKAYLDHVRTGDRYESREHDFGFDRMEVSVVRG